ncbi:hypothetical protein [Bifidobacterium subtile]|uniref:hypothetical protein n=1 Tax=Bifidobacterium subtile TaxID=77635 RepID=UPI002F360EE2
MLAADIVHGRVTQREAPCSRVEGAGPVRGILHAIREHDAFIIVIEAVSRKLGEHNADLAGGSKPDNGEALLAGAERASIMLAATSHEFERMNRHGNALRAAFGAIALARAEAGYGLAFHAAVAEPFDGVVCAVWRSINVTRLEHHEIIAGAIGEVLIVERLQIGDCYSAVFLGEADPCGAAAITAIDDRKIVVDTLLAQLDGVGVGDFAVFRYDACLNAPQLLGPQLHLHVEKRTQRLRSADAGVGDQCNQRINCRSLLLPIKVGESCVLDGEFVA